MNLIAVASLDDPRLTDYRDLKERHLVAESGRFVAESELVVRKLLASGLGIDSILVTENRATALAAGAETVRPNIPVYVVSRAIMDGVAGFPVHRGCLAIGQRPTGASIPQGARLVVVVEDVVDVDNIGGIVRNACAFGADALLLSPHAADPYYRKALRVAMGNTFALPIVRAGAWPGDLAALKNRGFSIAGTVLDGAATPLAEAKVQGPLALVFGAEGPGLTPAAMALCDQRLTIPMSNADSLNVATACGIFLHHLTRVLHTLPPTVTAT